MPSMNPSSSPTGRESLSATDARIALLADVGAGVLRYGVVFLLLAIGTAKYFAFEAEGIKPLVENSPVLSWMLSAFGVRGASSIIGTLEIATGLAIASRRLSPTVSALGSSAGVLTFLTTLSFLFSTPGALSPMHPANAFLLKDVVLLGACLFTAAEAFGAARSARIARRNAGPVGVAATNAA